jgi:hypothetical protein
VDPAGFGRSRGSSPSGILKPNRIGSDRLFAGEPVDPALTRIVVRHANGLRVDGYYDLVASSLDGSTARILRRIEIMK